MRFVFCRMLTCTVVEMQQHKAETPSSLQHNLWTRLSPIYATKCLLHCSPLRYQHLSSGIILSGTDAIIVFLYIIKHFLKVYLMSYQRLYFWLVSYFLLQQWQQRFFPPSVLLWPTSHTHLHVNCPCCSENGLPLRPITGMGRDGAGFIVQLQSELCGLVTF